MANFSQVVICGRLTADPELKTTADGTMVTQFSVAVNKPGKNKASFFNVTAWRSTAKFITQYFHIGSSILIGGTLEQHTWTDKNDNNRSTVEIIAEKVDFVDSKGKSESSFAPPQVVRPVSADRTKKDAEFVAVQNTFAEINDDELPF